MEWLRGGEVGGKGEGRGREGGGKGEGRGREGGGRGGECFRHSNMYMFLSVTSSL